MKFKVGDKVKKVSNGIVGTVIQVGDGPWGEGFPYRVKFERCTNWFTEQELEEV